MDPSRKRTDPARRGAQRRRRAGRRPRLHELHRVQRGAQAEPAARRQRQPGETYQLTGKVEPPATRASGNGHALPRPRPHGHALRAGDLRRRARRTRSARGARSIVDVRKQGDICVGETDSLVTKCPSKFTAEQRSPDVLVAGKACLILALADVPVRHRRLAVRRAHRPAGVRGLRAPRGLRARRHRGDRVRRCSRWRSCARTSRSSSSRRTRRRRRRPSTAPPRSGPRRRARCCCGCCC